MHQNFFGNVREAFSSKEEPDKAATGTVPTILIIAGFAVVAVLVTTWIGNSIAWQAHLQARCISEQDGFSSFSQGTPDKKCIGAEDSNFKGPGVISNQIENTKGGRF